MQLFFQGLPVDMSSNEAPQPTFEALVYMALEICGCCKLFDANIMLSFHHSKSRSVSFEIFPLTFSVHMFYLYPMLYIVQGA